MTKKKKSKSKASKVKSSDDPSSSNTVVTDDPVKGERNIDGLAADAAAKLPAKSPNKKKRKLDVDSPEESKKPPKKRKKKKKKKRKQEKNDDKNALSDSEDADAPVFEGSMVGDMMVLIDRNNAKVYSATELNETGERLEVGKLGEDGKVLLFESKKEDESRVASEFPFETDPDDHCESPLEAYNDIVPFLNAFGGKPSSKLFIYDPYFCDGRVARNLESLGFPNVYNRKEDCYKVWSSSSYPKHDILITNPPYSGDHIEKLVDHITSPAFGERPWMLLLPQWVHKKDYFISKTKHIRPFYLVPKRRYVYLPPPSFREAKKSDVHKKSSPFVSMWFLWGGTKARNEQWLTKVARQVKDCEVARSKSALRDLRRKGTKKR